MRCRLFRLTLLLVSALFLCGACAAVSGITGPGEKPAVSVPERPSGKKIPLPPMVEDFGSSQDEAGSEAP